MWTEGLTVEIKLRFRDGLVWTVGLTVEIKLRSRDRLVWTVGLTVEIKSPPVVAYKRTLNLRDLLVRTQLRDNTNPQRKAPPGIYKCNHPRCLTCPFLQEGQTKYTFSATKEERRINDNLNCKSKNLIYLIECKKCTKQYIGETKRQLHERFGEHRRSIQNHHQLIKPTPVSTHFNQPGHSIDHLLLTPLELIHNTRDSVRKAREAHLIN